MSLIIQLPDPILFDIDSHLIYDEPLSLMQLELPITSCPLTWPDLTIEEFQILLIDHFLLCTSCTSENFYDPPSDSPTNQEMHALNGNHIPHTNFDYLPGVEPLVQLENTLHQAYADTPRIVEKFRRRGKYSSDEALAHYKDYFKNSKEYEPGTPEYDGWLRYYNNNSSKLKKLVGKTKPLPPPIKTISVPTVEASQLMRKIGPTNQEMHAYNGNPPKFGPRTKAQTERTQRKNKRNRKKRFETKNYLKTIRSGAGRFPQNRPKKKLPSAVKAAGKIEKREQIIARKYSAFLRNPVFEPPRLGSTGNTPTMLVHGYYRKAFSMAAPTDDVVNATCVSACINPRIFKSLSSVTSYVAPIVINFTQSGSIVPTISNTTGDVKVETFTNDVALKNQVLGHSTEGLASPAGRWIGGSITLECRCPMATVAPPFMFGGLLPEYPTEDVLNIKVDSQLSSFAIDNIRNLQSSVEVPGFSVSSVYIPNTPNALNFNGYTAEYASTKRQPVTSIPYVGMTNCPTTATVEITVSSWFEVQQNTYYAAGTTVSTGDYAGWVIGPRVSSEDVFDNLKRFAPVSTRMIGMGAKSSSASSSFAALAAARDRSLRPPEPTLQDEISFLKKQYELLRLKIEDEEDEKFINEDYSSHLDRPDTPQYKGLSKSTLDLAMSIKKTLTPGSVTHKTVPNNLP